MSVLEIQFVGNKNFFVGSDGVSVRGQILRIGPGEVGETFTYLSPRQQMEQFNSQEWVLLAAYDDDGEPVDHGDVGVRYDADNPYIEAGQEDTVPSGIPDHMPALQKMVERTAPDDGLRGQENAEEAEEEVEETPKPKPKRRASKKRTAKKS